MDVALLALGMVAMSGWLLFTKTPGLGYETVARNHAGVEGVAAPHYLPNLAREALTGKPWSVALKDGVQGYLGKALSRKSTETQPPVVGVWLMLLGLGWIGWGLWMARQDHAKN
jgi:hypothetical protein